MTHHIHNTKQVAEDYVKKIRSNRYTFEKTICSYCSRPANQFDFLDERNFVPIKGKTINGQQAVALYGSCCLNDARRVNDIKRAFIITQTRAGDLVPEYIPLRSLKDDEEPEEKKADVGSNERVEGKQVTSKDNATDELSTGTSKGKELEPEEKKSIFGGITRIIKKDE